MITRITLIAKKPYEINGNTGITYGGYPEEKILDKSYIVFTSPESLDYEIFPEARAGKKFNPENSIEVEIFEHFDMFSGKSKLKDVRPKED